MKEISREEIEKRMEVIEKNNQVLIKLLDKLEGEATKEPINTLNISALSDAIKTLKII